MRFLDHGEPDVFRNLALDDALLYDAEEHGTGPLLRIWHQPTLAVVLGASGRIGADVDVDRCRADGVTIARRSSGGGTVLIGPGVLQFAVVLPIASSPEYGAVDRAQKSVLGRCADSLNALLERNVPRLEVLGSADLAIAGRKCSGSAQRRLRDWFLVHASLLFDFPIELVSRYLKLPERRPAYRENRSHEEFLTNFQRSREAITESLRSAWAAAAEPTSVPDRVSDRAKEIVQSKLSRPEWIDRL
ncbi:MAG: lipoate--protein ligase family protein [Isosphaeraceae bacterium]|nr:lipoate--protein ligase family protein [Isosphaeraceae bacterium]